MPGTIHKVTKSLSRTSSPFAGGKVQEDSRSEGWDRFALVVSLPAALAIATYVEAVTDAEVQLVAKWVLHALVQETFPIEQLCRALNQSTAERYERSQTA